MKFQTGMKTSSVNMKFHFGCISKRPNILMDMCRHFISVSVYMIFYHTIWTLCFKMTNMKSIPALSNMHICTLSATSNKSALIHSVPGKLFSFWSKWPIWNPYHFEFHFTSIHMNTSKELTEHRSEIFNWNEISRGFELISPLMWTYSKKVCIPLENIKNLGISSLKVFIVLRSKL